MASRRRLAQNEDTRLKIQTSQLVNRLQDHVFKDAEISTTQMKAIEILLRKTLPDMSSVDLQADVDVTTQTKEQRDAAVAAAARADR